MKKEYSTIKLSKYTKDQLGYVQRLLQNETKKMFISHDVAVLYSIDCVLKNKNIDKKKEVTDHDVQLYERLVKKHSTERDRVDNHLDPKTKLQLKRVIDINYQLGKTKKKMSYDELILSMFNVYVEKFPDLQKYLDQDQFMKLEIELSKALKKEDRLNGLDDD